MIYKLIVNAAFLAIGYYIGKEVSRGELLRGGPKAHHASTADITEKESPTTIKNDART